MTLGPLTVPTNPRESAVLAGEPLDLSRVDRGILGQLAHSDERVVTYEALERAVVGFEALGARRRILASVHRLRQLLAPHEVLIADIWGVGFRLRLSQEALA